MIPATTPWFPRLRVARPIPLVDPCTNGSSSCRRARRRAGHPWGSRCPVRTRRPLQGITQVIAFAFIIVVFVPARSDSRPQLAAYRGRDPVRQNRHFLLGLRLHPYTRTRLGSAIPAHHAPLSL